MKTLRAVPLLLALAACEHPATDQTPRVLVPSSSASPAATAAQPASDCAFWGGRGFSLKYGEYASLATFYRRFEYSDASGALHVTDSDIKRHVVDKTITLAPAERDALAGELGKLCPTDKDFKRGNAPGGGSTIEVTGRSGATAKVESWDASGAVRGALSKRFPELK